MTTPAASSARPEPIALTPEEHAAIARVFEGGKPVFAALSTLRTRRIGLGYRSETGEEENFDWSSHLVVRQREGPLAFESPNQPIPLSEVEEALIAWAPLGPNGIVTADIPVQGDLSSLLSWAGRTVPASSNDQGVDLFIINDQGIHLYRPGTERMAPVEINGPGRLLEDPPLVPHGPHEDLGPAAGCRLGDGASRDAQREHDGRAPVQRQPPGQHVVPPRRRCRARVGEPAAFVVPVRRLLPAGRRRRTSPPAATSGSAPDSSKSASPSRFSMSSRSCSTSPRSPASSRTSASPARAMGLGAWAMGGYSDDLLLGAYPEVAAGLGFSFLERDPARNPSKTATCQGLPGVLDASHGALAQVPERRGARPACGGSALRARCAPLPDR